MDQSIPVTTIKKDKTTTTTGPTATTTTTTHPATTTTQHSPVESMLNPGINYWIRPTSANQGTRRQAQGRGLFSGLQDVKHYNVEAGWAERHVVDEPHQGQGKGFWAWWFGRG